MSEPKIEDNFIIFLFTKEGHHVSHSHDEMRCALYDEL